MPDGCQSHSSAHRTQKERLSNKRRPSIKLKATGEYESEQPSRDDLQPFVTLQINVIVPVVPSGCPRHSSADQTQKNQLSNKRRPSIKLKVTDECKPVNAPANLFATVIFVGEGGQPALHSDHIALPLLIIYFKTSFK